MLVLYVLLSLLIIFYLARLVVVMVLNYFQQIKREKLDEYEFIHLEKNYKFETNLVPTTNTYQQHCLEAGSNQLSQSKEQECILFGFNFCRSNFKYCWLNKNVSNIGCRNSKHLFLINQNKIQLVMMFNSLQKCKLDFRMYATQETMSEFLQKLNHKYIQQIIKIQFDSKKDICMVVSKLQKCSLKDLLYGVQNKLWDYRKKYKPNVKGNRLKISQIQQYGHQLLQGLKYLHDHNYYHNNLHLGNVLINSKDQVKLADLQNYLLNLKPRYFKNIRQMMQQIDKSNMGKFKSVHQVIDILQFGQILYEISSGIQLRILQPDINDFCLIDKQIQNILMMIFPQQYSDYQFNLPTVTIDELLNNEFFSSKEDDEPSYQYLNAVSEDDSQCGESIDWTSRCIQLLNQKNYSKIK